MIGVNISVPQEDIIRLNSTFKRYVEYYHGNMAKAIEKTFVQIIKALSGSTKVSAKKRPIVANPNPRAKKDARLAPYGVFKFSQKKGKYFSPIKGTGEYGAPIRYVGRDKVLLRVRGGWEVFNKSELESMNMGSRTLQNHPKRIIGRSGLAKSSWKWMLGKLGAVASGVTSNQSEIKGTVSARKVKETIGISDYFAIFSENKLNYIRKAMLGKKPIDTVLARAESLMVGDMKGLHKRAKQSAGMRAA